METLSVGILIDVVYPYTHGGAEKRYAMLARELGARGHDVTVYAMNWWNGPRSFEDNGVRYVAVSSPRALYANGARRSLVQPALYGLRAVRGLQGSNHDLIDCNQFPYVHLPSAHLSSALRRTPMLVTWHEVWRDYWFEYAPFPAGMIGAAIEGVSPHLATLNLAVSHHTAGRLEAMGVRPEKIAVVPNPIDLAALDRVRAAPEPVDLIYAGRLVAHKRVDRVLAAVARLRRTHPGLRMAIVGTGPEEARLRALARGLGLAENVTFTGSLKEEADLVARLKSAKVFVCASEREGFCTAALEAMACGLPVVTVDGPLNALAHELVRHGHNGLVVREPRARALAAALDALLSDEPARTRLGDRARLTAEGYDQRPLGLRLEAVYRGVLQREVRGRAVVKARGADAVLAR